MIIGFTGTREGMTSKQRIQFAEFILKLNPKEFHHGDCVGADDGAATIVHQSRNVSTNLFPIKIKIVKHPPLRGRYQANNPYFEEVRPDLPYLERNTNIAQECDVLIAAPKEREMQHRRGTWHTIRQAWKDGKTTIIISP